MLAYRRNPRLAFSLLELLIVVAILAIIAGGLIVAYEGLEGKSAKGVATYNIGALDNAIRTFHGVNKSYPDEWDSMMFTADGTATDSTATRINIMPDKLRGKLGAYTLLAADVTALNDKGIRISRYLSGALPAPYDNAAYPSSTVSTIPTRIFDNPTRGWGVPVTLAPGTKVAVVEGLGIANFNGGVPTNSSRLRDIGGLNETRAHLVVAFGIGNNLSMVKSQDGFGAGISEAPTYGDAQKHEYNRFIALFHLASSTDATLANLGPRKCKLLAVLDTKGDWYDEEASEYSGQKP